MPEKEIAMFVEGHGFGHAARMFNLAKKLNAKVITFKDGARFFRERGYDVIEIKEPYPLLFNDKEFDLFSSFKETLKLFDVSTVKTLNDEMKDASLVIVDSSLLGLVSAKAYRKKLVFVSNNTDVSVFFTGQKGKIVGESVAKLISSSDKILICDFPPPYSVSLYNVKPLPNMEFIGPLVDVSDIQKGKKTYGLVSTGADEYSSISSAISKVNFSDKVISRFHSSNKTIKRVKDIRPYLGKAKWLITHGGHSTIMESILLGIPMIVIPQDNYAERLNNALMVEKLGLGVRLYEEYLSPLIIEKAIEDALDLRKNVRKFSKWAKRFKAEKRVMDIVQNLL